MIAADANPATFDCWAPTYSTEVNPFLTLEARTLRFLLPQLSGCTVLDAGCGIGRHFDMLLSRGASHLHAVDSSAAMLARARTVARPNIHLHNAACDDIPLASASVDVAICSMVLGYLPDVSAFLSEMQRVLRRSGYLVITDMHPDTALAHGWHRSFAAGGQHFSIHWNRLSVRAIRQAILRAGFTVSCDVELPFAEPEHDLLEQAGRTSAGSALGAAPALYGMALRASVGPAVSRFYFGGRCALSPCDAVEGSLQISGNLLAGVTAGKQQPASSSVDLSGYMLLPGLINAHDHLEFGLFPQLSAGPYTDSMEWAADIHARFADTIASYKAISKATHSRFGALRNLLCGVTTVCQHNPITAEMLDPSFPIHVVQEVRWAHSLGVDRSGVEQAAKCADGTPFIVHAGEGVSRRAEAELLDMQKLGLLQPTTVLVHTLSAGEDFLHEAESAGVGLIACPSSNKLLFGAVPHNHLVEHYPFAALGSDSPLTAAGDLLDEVRFVDGQYAMKAARLYELVTVNSARLLMLQHGAGMLCVGAPADFIAVPDRGLSPAETLCSLSWKDVHLVVRDGCVQLASQVMHDRLPENLPTRLLVDGEVRWVRGNWKHDFGDAEAVTVDGSVLVCGRRVALA